MVERSSGIGGPYYFSMDGDEGIAENTKADSGLSGPAASAHALLKAMGGAREAGAGKVSATMIDGALHVQFGPETVVVHPVADDSRVDEWLATTDGSISYREWLSLS